MKKSIRPYIWSIVVTLAIGGLSAFLIRNDVPFYNANIIKPAFTPPDWLFPIVWNILYVLMGWGLGRVLSHSTSSQERSAAIQIYAIQLFFNFLWSIVFFHVRAFWFAWVWLLILWLLILCMIFVFYRTSKLAAVLQIPYFLWVTFAAYLNFMVARLN